jgi:hypothetical protein
MNRALALSRISMLPQDPPTFFSTLGAAAGLARKPDASAAGGAHPAIDAF